LSKIVNLVKKDLKLLVNDPLSLLFMILLPISISLVAATVFSPKKTNSFTIPVGYVDNDNSALSDFLAGAFANERMKEFFHFVKLSEEEGKKQIEENKIAGMIVIPKGFEDGFFNGKKVSLKLVTNPAREISTGILEDVFSIMTDMLDGVRVLFKKELKTVYGMKEFNSIKLLELTKIGYDKIQDMKDIVLTNRLEFVKEKSKEKSFSGSIAIYFLPGMAFMTIMFVVAGFFKTLMEEIETMTVVRILVAPVNSSQILIAKFLYSLVAILFVQIVLWIIAIPLFNIHIFSFFLLIKGVLLMAFTGTVFLALIYSVPLKATVIESIVSVVIILVCLFGGIFITPHTMPGKVASIINLSPFYFPIKLINSAFGVSEKGIMTDNQILFAVGLVVVGGIALYMFKNKINKLVKG